MAAGYVCVIEFYILHTQIIYIQILCDIPSSHIYIIYIYFFEIDIHHIYIVKAMTTTRLD